MKKKLLTGFAIATLAVSGFMAAQQNSQSVLSDLQMENIEVLTATESISLKNKYCIWNPEYDCWIRLSNGKGYIYNEMTLRSIYL